MGCRSTHIIYISTDNCKRAEDQLFDFDAEIGPLLEVVASKTLEQSLLEVEEEAELKRIRRRQEELTQIQQRRRQKIHELELYKRHEWDQKQDRVAKEQDRVAKETVVYRYGAVCVQQPYAWAKHPTTQHRHNSFAHILMSYPATHQM